MHLARHALHRVAAGRRIRCLAGTLWVTPDREPVDLVLEAGASHRDRRSALVQALDDASFIVD